MGVRMEERGWAVQLWSVLIFLSSWVFGQWSTLYTFLRFHLQQFPEHSPSNWFVVIGFH